MNALRVLLAVSVVASALVGACARPPLEDARVETEARKPLRAVMPSPNRGRMFEAVTLNEGCVACHRDVAEEWQASLHKTANTEPAYRRSFAIEPLAFCRSCHAPEAVAYEEEPEAVSAIGVACVTCHVTEGSAVLAAPSSSGGEERAPHAVVRSKAFAGADACESCHQFRFPTLHTGGLDSFMQTTISEHAASPAKDQSCADCHMSKGENGRRSHTFAVSRDPEILRAAVHIEATRTSDTAVELVLTPIDPGHAFPTGDLFRRLEVWAEVAGPDEMSLAKASRYLTRHWGFRPGHMARVLLSDDRLRSEPVRIPLELGSEGAGRDIVWRVAYQRVAHPKGVDEADAEIDGEIVLASGRLPSAGRPWPSTSTSTSTSTTETALPPAAVPR